MPAPATHVIIKKYRIPIEPGPVAMELFTPTGAALLAALTPAYLERIDLPQGTPYGLGYGTTEFKATDKIKSSLFLYTKDY